MKLKNPTKDVRTIKRLLTGAETEARRDGQSMPGPEHLLLSALGMPDGSARRAFERVGADPDDVRAAIAAQHADALRAIGIEPPDDELLDQPAVEHKLTGAFRSSASAQSAFKAAAEITRRTRAPLVGAHVVAAVAEMERGTAPRALAHMGVDRAALATAARMEAGLQTA